WISYFTWGKKTLGESGAYLTSHDDTIVWVVMVMALILHMLMRERTKITVILLDGIAILFIIAAIQFNSRRLAWVSLAMGLTVMYLLLPQGKARKRITRFLIVLVPLIALYVAVGWGRSSPIFLPLKSLETVSTKEDGSTLARNAENLGLIATANSWGPLLGSGWGKPYICLTRKYDISQAFELWEYVPHNSILGILAFTGMVGAGVFWFVITTSVFFNVRVARLSTDRLTRAVGIIG